jgi:hypothetical protein
MELRKHPRMRCLGRLNWPPEWKGPYGPNNPLPHGEVGILIRVEAASSVLTTPHCNIIIQWNDREYLGSLYFDEKDFLQEIVGLLQSCVGRPIAEIGSLDIP